MSQTHTYRPAGIDPRMPTQTTRVGKGGATTNYSTTKPAPPVPKDPVMIPMRAYSVKDAFKSMHREHHENGENIGKALKSLTGNPFEAQVQAFEERMRQMVAEINREVEDTFFAVTKPAMTPHGGEQVELSKAIETLAIKERVKTQALPETDHGVSNGSSTRTSMVSTLNLPSPMLQSPPREASSSTSRAQHHTKGAPWAPATPPETSPERHAVYSRTRHDERRSDAGTNKGKQPERRDGSNSQGHWQYTERSNLSVVNGKKPGSEDFRYQLGARYPRENRA